MPGRPYRVYTDACDYRLAGILQQVQPIWIGDLKGTKLYKQLERAKVANEPIIPLELLVQKDMVLSLIIMVTQATAQVGVSSYSFCTP